MVHLRDDTRLKDLEDRIRQTSFLLREFMIGIVPEADESNDTYASDNLTRYYRYLERLNGIKENYN
jgi:hypothetical protein